MNLLHFFFPVFKARSRWVDFFYEISFDLTDLCKHRSDWRRPQGFEGGSYKNKLLLSSTNNHKGPQIFVIYTNEAASPSSWDSGVLDSYKYSILVKAWCEGFHLWIKAASVTNSDQQQMESFTFIVHTWAQIKVPLGSEGERWEDFLCLASLSPPFPSIPPVIHSAAANKALRKSTSLGIPSW